MAPQHVLSPQSELTILYEVFRFSQPQNRPPELNDYFNEVMTLLSSHFSIGYSALILRDSQKDSFRLEAAFGAEKDGHPFSFGNWKGMMAKVITTQEPMVIQPPSQEPIHERDKAAEGQPPQPRPPLLFIPLLTDGEPCGVIHIESLYSGKGEFLKDFQFLLLIASILTPVVKSYHEKREDSLAKHGKAKLKFFALEEFLNEKVGEVLNKIDPYVEAKTGMGIYDDIVSLVEKILIKSALERVDYVQVTAAQLLGINRNTLRKKIKDLKIKTR
jgi:transcriptional regulator with GAF, ATPase, and Fis domain